MIRLRIGLVIALGVQMAAAAAPSDAEGPVPGAPDRTAATSKPVPPVLRRLEPPDSQIVILPGAPPFVVAPAQAQPIVSPNDTGGPKASKAAVPAPAVNVGPAKPPAIATKVLPAVRTDGKPAPGKPKPVPALAAKPVTQAEPADARSKPSPFAASAKGSPVPTPMAPASGPTPVVAASPAKVVHAPPAVPAGKPAPDVAASP